MKLPNGKRIPSKLVHEIGVFLYSGSQTVEQIVEYCKKRHSGLHITSADVLAIDDFIKERKK